tara:strand:+ start:298 stop:576 length:279 start_codon:yes stop_codon:yes gene_type:complete
MKIFEEYIAYETSTPKVVDANYVGDFSIRISFSDQSQKLVDFKSFIDNSTHPDVFKYKKEDIFKAFEIKEGNLSWNDFEMIFPLSDLYRGFI